MTNLLPFAVGVLIGCVVAWLVRARMATDEAARFRSEASGRTADAERKRGEYESLKSDFERRALEFATLKAENTGLHEEISKLQLRCETLTSDLNARDGNTESLREQMEALRESVATAEEETKEARRESDRLRGDIARLQGELDGSGADTDRLRSDWEAMRQENARLRAGLAPPTDAMKRPPSAPAHSAPPADAPGPEPAPVETEIPLPPGIPARRGEDEDDVETINGIGPTMGRQLRAAGVRTFRQIALLTPEGIAHIGKNLPAFRGRVERENWREQARTRHREKYGEDVTD